MIEFGNTARIAMPRFSGGDIRMRTPQWAALLTLASKANAFGSNQVTGAS